MLWRIPCCPVRADAWRMFRGLDRPERPAISARPVSDPAPPTHAEPEPASTWWRSAVPEGLWLPLEQAVAVDPTLRRAQAQTHRRPGTSGTGRGQHRPGPVARRGRRHTDGIRGQDGQPVDRRRRRPADRCQRRTRPRVDAARNIWIARRRCRATAIRSGPRFPDRGDRRCRGQPAARPADCADRAGPDAAAPDRAALHPGSSIQRRRTATA